MANIALDKKAQANFFNPAFQQKFWADISPNITKVIDDYERMETWVHRYEDTPNIFIELSSMLPSMVGVEPKPEEKSILSSLISVLSQIPFKQSLFAIAWLERGVKDDEMGWGLMLYSEAVEIAGRYSEDDEKVLSARILRDRVAILIKSRIMVKIVAKLEL